jgi:hypothetical protein
MTIGADMSPLSRPQCSPPQRSVIVAVTWIRVKMPRTSPAPMAMPINAATEFASPSHAVSDRRQR